MLPYRDDEFPIGAGMSADLPLSLLLPKDSGKSRDRQGSKHLNGSVVQSPRQLAPDLGRWFPARPFRFHRRQPLRRAGRAGHDHRAGRIGFDDPLQLVGVDHFLLDQPLRPGPPGPSARFQDVADLLQRLVDDPLDLLVDLAGRLFAVVSLAAGFVAVQPGRATAMLSR